MHEEAPSGPFPQALLTMPVSASLSSWSPGAWRAHGPERARVDARVGKPRLQTSSFLALGGAKQLPNSEEDEPNCRQVLSQGSWEILLRPRRAWKASSPEGGGPPSPPRKPRGPRWGVRGGGVPPPGRRPSPPRRSCLPRGRRRPAPPAPPSLPSRQGARAAEPLLPAPGHLTRRPRDAGRGLGGGGGARSLGLPGLGRPAPLLSLPEPFPRNGQRQPPV